MKTVNQKEFCANPKCLNHLLPMTDDRHYHSSDKGVYTTEAVIYALPCTIITKIKRKRFLITKTEYKREMIYFCEICMSAVDMVGRENHV